MQQGYSSSEIRTAKRAAILIGLLMLAIIAYLSLWPVWHERLGNLGHGLMVYDPSSLLSSSTKNRLTKKLKLIKAQENVFFSAAVFRKYKLFEDSTEGTELLKPQSNEVRVVLIVETGDIFVLPGEKIRFPQAMVPEGEIVFALKTGDPDFALLKQLSVLFQHFSFKSPPDLWRN